jgi:hypothetical protein
MKVKTNVKAGEDQDPFVLDVTCDGRLRVPVG